MKAAPRRKRNAEATREDILQAGISCFAADAYDRVGVRQIAAMAGVDPALVIRYFGSKEGLFQEAVQSVQTDLDPDTLAPEHWPLIGAGFARTITEPRIRDSLLLTIRAATSSTAAQLVADRIREAYANPLAAHMGGSHAQMRAELLNAVLLGAAAAYWILDFESMHGEGEEAFIELTGRLCQQLLDDLEPAG